MRTIFFLIYKINKRIKWFAAFLCICFVCLISFLPGELLAWIAIEPVVHLHLITTLPLMLFSYIGSYCMILRREQAPNQRDKYLLLLRIGSALLPILASFLIAWALVHDASQAFDWITGSFGLNGLIVGAIVVFVTLFLQWGISFFVSKHNNFKEYAKKQETKEQTEEQLRINYKYTKNQKLKPFSENKQNNPILKIPSSIQEAYQIKEQEYKKIADQSGDKVKETAFGVQLYSIVRFILGLDDEEQAKKNRPIFIKIILSYLPDVKTPIKSNSEVIEKIEYIIKNTPSNQRAKRVSDIIHELIESEELSKEAADNLVTPFMMQGKSKIMEENKENKIKVPLAICVCDPTDRHASKNKILNFTEAFYLSAQGIKTQEETQKQRKESIEAQLIRDSAEAFGIQIPGPTSLEEYQKLGNLHDLKPKYTVLEKQNLGNKKTL